MLRTAFLPANAFESLETPFLSEAIVSRSRNPEPQPEAEGEAPDAAETEADDEAERLADHQAAAESFAIAPEPYEEALDFIERPENEVASFAAEAEAWPVDREGDHDEAQVQDEARENESFDAWEAAAPTVTDGFAPADVSYEQDATAAEAGDAGVSDEADWESSSEVDVASEDEVLGNEDRVVVSDALVVPNRWICAVDIWEANPKFGTNTTEPREIIKARGTGIVIGPRHVLTARHVVEGFVAGGAGRIKRISVSAARHGDNSSNPFGVRNVLTMHQSRPFLVDPRNPRSLVRDDCALLVLDKDLAGATHKRLSVPLGFWGENQRVAVIAALADNVLHGAAVNITGYPGDSCGTKLMKSKSTSMEKLIENCRARPADEWASTQFGAPGVLDARNHPRVMFHTVDTFKGQSGAPICLGRDRVLNLVGIHIDGDNAQRNQGQRLTPRLLNEIAAWINLDPAIATATVQNDTLTVRRPAPAPARASEMEQGDDREI